MAAQERSTSMPAALDRTVILCRPGGEGLGIAWEIHDPTGGFEQSDDGAPHVVITERTSDEKCARLGKRFGIEASRLIKFRDTPALRRVVVVDARSHHG